jgi:hypothetical protein
MQNYKELSYVDIYNNRFFFQNCAKSHRDLATKLIHRLANYLNIQIDNNFPYQSFREFRQGKKQKGAFDDWQYFLHGFHCRFTNISSGQVIEVSLVFGLEFGVLDPLFFIDYIKTSEYKNSIPFQIDDAYHDGIRIIEVMTDIGIFEKTHSNIEGYFGFVIADREKVEITTYNNIDYVTKEQKGIYSGIWFKIKQFFKQIE